jgi:hypothetical protein
LIVFSRHSIGACWGKLEKQEKRIVLVEMGREVLSTMLDCIVSPVSLAAAEIAQSRFQNDFSSFQL